MRFALYAVLAAALLYVACLWHFYGRHFIFERPLAPNGALIDGLSVHKDELTIRFYAATSGVSSISSCDAERVDGYALSGLSESRCPVLDFLNIKS